MFDLQHFIADCETAVREKDSHLAVKEIVARAVADPTAVLKTVGEPTGGALQTLHKSSALTILNIVWPPMMTVMPHNHQMWAVIGIYTGREDNIFWRRLEGGDGRGLEAAGAKALSEKDTTPLGRDIIHSVTNPIPRLTGSIHVYGGDFFGADRSEWDPETLRERRFDVARTRKLFAGT
jgi:predicted metal-dependent enzyme (double-stranded beta helix superfamily)